MKQSPTQFRAARLSPMLGVESLERRALLATSFSHGFVGVRGTSGPDVIDVSQVDQDLIVTMNGVSNTFDVALVQGLRINGLSGDDQVTISDGVSVDATLTGGRGNDMLDGGDGDDSVRGGPGNDSIDGGSGDDDLLGDSGNDDIGGDDGDDSVSGGTGDDTCDGGWGNDEVDGDNGNDVLDGDDGDDQLDGGVGDDSLDGGAGNDVEDGDSGNDELAGGDGDDSLDGGTGNDVEDGDDGNDELTGGDGADALDGGSGDDECLGGDHDDTIHGGEGDDHLDGENGDDLLDGDEGNDQEEDGLSVDLDMELEAELIGPTDASGHAEFETEPEDVGLEFEFSLQVEHATPGSVLDVLVDGFLAGQVTVDDLGRGELHFSSDPDEPDEFDFPDGFPSVGEGSLVTVGDVLQGLLTAVQEPQ